MTYPNGDLAPIAQEASRATFLAGKQEYEFTRLFEGIPGTGQLFPVAVAGKFAVDGTGIYTGLVDTDSERAANFHPMDIEASAFAGQYRLPELLDAFPVEASEAEEFIHDNSPVMSDNNVRLKLIAGIQVMRSVARDELVPLLIHHRSLGNFVFRKRQEIFSTLAGVGATPEELMDRVPPDERLRYELIISPNEEVLRATSVAVAKALLQDHKMTYQD